MACTITQNTVSRALSGLMQKKTKESFARIGADYRTSQKLQIEKLINWLAEVLVPGYSLRTEQEIKYKESVLNNDFDQFSKEILKAKRAADQTFSIRFKIDNEPMEIISYPGDTNKLFVKHNGHEKELEGVNLKELKRIFLWEYLKLHKDDGVPIDITEFDLTGTNLSAFNFKNVLMPELDSCKLYEIDFDTRTVFKSRRNCDIDDAGSCQQRCRVKSCC